MLTGWAFEAWRSDAGRPRTDVPEGRARADGRGAGASGVLARKAARGTDDRACRGRSQRLAGPVTGRAGDGAGGPGVSTLPGQEGIEVQRQGPGLGDLRLAVPVHQHERADALAARTTHITRSPSRSRASSSSLPVTTSEITSRLSRCQSAPAIRRPRGWRASSHTVHRASTSSASAPSTSGAVERSTATRPRRPAPRRRRTLHRRRTRRRPARATPPHRGPNACAGPRAHSRSPETSLRPPFSSLRSSSLVVRRAVTPGPAKHLLPGYLPVRQDPSSRARRQHHPEDSGADDRARVADTTRQPQHQDKDSP